MKAAVLRGDKFVLEEVPTPVLEGKGAVIKVYGCGLCGSDIVKYTHHFAKDGAILGHEVVGEIVQINTDTDFKVGDRVAAAHHYPCFECNYCKHENYSMCETFKRSNIIPGGFSEYILVDENHLKYTVFKLPSSLEFLTASFTEPLACCYRAVNRAGWIKGDKVAIVGLGSIGILMGQICKTLGATVIGFDINPERAEKALHYGFDDACLSSVPDKISADTVFLTAGADAAVDTALRQVRNGGKICVFSSTKTDTPAFPNNEIYYRELTVFGSYSPSPNDLKQSFELLKTKKINVENMSVVYNIGKLNEAIEDTRSGKILKAFIKVGD